MPGHATKTAVAETSKRKSREAFRSLFHQILQLAYQGLPRIDFLREVSRLLLEFSGTDAVELRLIERNKHYRSEAVGDPEHPQIIFDVIPLAQDDTGALLPARDGGSDPERLFWHLLQGDLQLEEAFFTRNGSFWIGDTRIPIQLRFRSETPRESSRFDLAGDYRSLILISIPGEDANIGLIALKSRKPYYFMEEEVSFYESLGHNLGVALTHRRAQVALRERVKELTCLYGIVRLMEKSDLSLNGLLQGIVNLLPPAWLYPHIAQGRITLHGMEFVTPGFRSGVQRQASDIMIHGVKCGSVEVSYTEEMPELDEGPFLKEERSLIDAVAREVAVAIEYREAEEEKEKLQEQLRHSDRLATIGQLTAGVAHELNEPLGNILGFAQLAKKTPDLPEQTAADLDKIISASLYAREVIRKLMLFSRQMPSRQISLNLNRVIEDGLTLLEGRLQRSSVQVVRFLAKDLPEITADPAQMNQVLVNLIVNATHAMPQGGTLTITTAHNRDFVFLTVQDSGIGMPPEIVKQIFIPFFTTKDVNQGTGLGLSVAHGIVASHGGTIQVESQVGKGSKFIIQLPIQRGNHNTKAAKPKENH